MNWTEMINQLQGQGSIFWIAAFSITAGATLLLVSGMIMARKTLMKGWISRFPGKINRTKVTGAVNQVKLTETGYSAPNHLAPASVSPAGSMDARQLGDLRQRLQAASQNLEDLHRELKNQDQIPGISALKPTGRDVEYVFKAGIGGN